MPKIIDLSHPITHQMDVFPGDPEVSILTHSHYENGYFVTQLIMGSHAGTHVDAPIHRLPGTKSISDMGIAPYAAFRAYVLDMPNLTAATEITKALLTQHKNALAGCDGILLRTGWSANWGSKAFFEGFPGLNEDAAEFFKENGIHLYGTESPSVNAARHGAVHTALLEREIAIVESLASLDQLSQKYVEFYAAPLKLLGRDGAPVRAFAVER
jgi:kynurenine formamidase